MRTALIGFYDGYAGQEKYALFGLKRQAAERALTPMQLREQKVLAQMRGTAPPRQLSRDEAGRAAKMLAITDPGPRYSRMQPSQVSHEYAASRKREHAKILELAERVQQGQEALAEKKRGAERQYYLGQEGARIVPRG
jgi:hypothetical protein